MANDSDKNPNNRTSEHTGSDAEQEKNVFLVLYDRLRIGPFSEAELAALGIRKENGRNFVRAAIETINGVRKEHVEIGTDIFWSIGELDRKGLPHAQLTFDEAVSAIRAGDEAELRRMKALVTELLEQDNI